MIVLDASVLVPALADDGEDGRRARIRLRGEAVTAPEVVDLEVASALRRGVSRGEVDRERGELALRDLARMPLVRASHRSLIGGIWALREALTPYDAAYVALAELLGVPLLTADRKLERAADACGCAVELVR